MGDLGVFRADCEAECLIAHVVAEMASQSVRLSSVVHDMVVRTNQAAGATSGRRTRVPDSGGAGFHRTRCAVRSVLLDSAHATVRHLRQE